MPEQFAICSLAKRWIKPKCIVEGVRADQWIDFALSIGTIARPSILGRMFDHTGPDGIELDIALARQQIALLLRQAGSESALPQSAAAAIGSVHILYIALTERLHHGADRPFGRCRHEQVDVVGHEHVGMDCTAVADAVLVEPVQIEPIVLVGEGAGLAIVSALDEMERDVGKYNTGAAWHGGIRG